MSSSYLTLGREIMEKISLVKKYHHVELMTGGISSLNYRLSTDGNSSHDLVMTIYSGLETWWKADKEINISRLYKRYQIPSFKILKTGYVKNNGQTYRYLIRNFVLTKDFSQVLYDEKTLTVKDWSTILDQLGTIIKSLHAITMTRYGIIWGKGVSGSDMTNIISASGWRSYIDRLMLNRKRQMEAIDKFYKIGNVSGADVQVLFKSLYELYNQIKLSLDTVKQPKLIHYDILLSNIILNKDSRDHRWGVSALIDNEWVSAGDPDIDLVQLENTIYFSPQRELFKKYWSYFNQAYNRDGVDSEDFRRKRIIYHMMRSIFYLIAVFMLDKSRRDIKDEITLAKIDANYRFLKHLIKNRNIGFSLFTD